MACANLDNWTAPSSTITYDRLTADYNNADRPGGGDGNLDITTGMFTALTPGHYTITYSGHAALNRDLAIDVFLYHNDQKVGDEGEWSLHPQPGQQELGECLNTTVVSCSTVLTMFPFRLSTWGWATPSTYRRAAPSSLERSTTSPSASLSRVLTTASWTTPVRGERDVYK